MKAKQILRDIVKIKSENEKHLFSLRNVVSVGIGKKVINGETTNNLAIIVGVVQKLPIEMLQQEDIIPESFTLKLGSSKVTIVTDVTEIGRISKLSLLQKTPQSQVDRVRPVKGGYSIGNVGITAGTCGCVAHRYLSNGLEESVLLSNAHIFTPDATKNVVNAVQILQPAPYDNGKNPDDLVANLVAYEPVKPAFDFSTCGYSNFAVNRLTRSAKLLKRQSRFYAIAESGEINLVDAAIARPLVPISEEVHGIGVPTKSVEAKINMVVAKSGRTTGLTQGIVTQIAVSISIVYGYNGFFPIIAMFKNQMIIEGNTFSQGGDSGSVIFTGNETEHHAVGLLFAGNEDGSITIANEMKEVQKILNLRIGSSKPNEKLPEVEIIDETEDSKKVSIDEVEGVLNRIDNNIDEIPK